MATSDLTCSSLESLSDSESELTDVDDQDQLDEGLDPEISSNQGQVQHEEVTVIPHKKSEARRFSSSALTILNRYYNNGMCGIGKRYDCLISCAAREAKLSVLQVKVR